MPSGQAASGKTIKVSLESVSNFGSFSTVADQDGVFRFRNLQAGGYTIVVETVVRDDAGKLIAKVTQTQLVLRPR